MNPQSYTVKALSESPFSGSLFKEDSKDDSLYFQSLGSGSSGNCSLLISGKEALIIDAGIGIRTFQRRALTLLNSDIKPKGILITHDHGDHIRGAVRIAHRLSVPIYTTQEGCSTLRRWSLASRYDVTAYLREITADVPFSIGNFSITAFDVPHDATRNVGFTIKGSAGTFSLITDIGQVTSRIRSAIRESNYLVFESNYDERMLLEGTYTASLKDRIKGGAGHLSNLKAGETLCEEMHPGLKFIALCHLSGNNNTPTLALNGFLDKMQHNGIGARRLLTDWDDEEETADSPVAVTIMERDIVSSLFRFGIK